MLQTDLGLGRLHYLVWWDFFNVMQIMVLVTVLILVLYEHRLVISEEELLAQSVNQVAIKAALLRIHILWLLLTLPHYPLPTSDSGY